MKRVAVAAPPATALPLAVTSSAPLPSEDRVAVSFELVERAREIAGPLPVAALFEKALRTYIGKHRPVAVRTRKNSAKKVPPPVAATRAEKVSRVISRPVARAVRTRDGGRCTYVAPDGTRCRERRALQIDHVTPHACGGGNDEENLRLLCPAHNQLCAERVFGRAMMLQKRAARRST